MARSLRNLFLLSLISLSGTVFGQSGPGEILGKVLDETKQPVINATVQVIQGGIVSGGGVTDYDGNYDLKPLNPGRFQVRVTYVGYDTSLTTNVVVSPDKTTEVNINLRKSTTTIHEVEIKAYKVPLIDKYSTSTTITSEQIEKLPTRETNDVAATSPGVYQSQRGGSLNLGGARSTGTLYIIDGVQVQGGQGVNLNQGSIDQVEVLTSGVSAKYGDATGGVINITTKGAASKFTGGVLIQHSVDGYNNNLASLNLAGPLYRKKMADGSRKSVIGFAIGAEGYLDHDRYPTYDPTLIASSSTLSKLSTNPLTIISDASGQQIYKYSSEFVTRDQLVAVKAPDHNGIREGRANARLDFQLADNLNLSAGGNFDYQETQNFKYYSIMFAPSSISTTYRYTTRGWLRFTQRFGKETSGNKSGVISNAYYTVQADFQNLNNSAEDPIFKKNIFEYGYVGKFNTNYTNLYSINTVDGHSGVTGTVLLSDRQPNGVSFSPGTLNPSLTSYTSEYYRTITSQPLNIATLQGKNALANGDVPRFVYDEFFNVGEGITGYGFSNSNQYSLAVDASFDLQVGKNRHAIQFGLYYQQRSQSTYSANANISNGGGTQSLWNLVRDPGGLINRHISLDTSNPIFVVNGIHYTNQQRMNGSVIPGPADTILYANVANLSTQEAFDKNLRKKLGLDPNGTDFINVDALDPKLLSLNMFSADELLNSGNSYIDYAGYTYTGEKQSGSVSFNDFFTKKDANGDFTRPIPAFSPNYTAGYLLDKFQFKDMNFNVGVRIERYDANTNVLIDPYSLYGEETVTAFQAAHPNLGKAPANIGSGFIPYVDNNLSATPTVVGYRNGDNWYDAQGNFIEDPAKLKIGGQDPQPALSDTNKISSAKFNPNSSFKNYVPQVNILPRISFSFPISDVALFYAHYDIYSQRPSSNNNGTTAATYYFLTQNANTIIDNPDLKPEKTFDYEVGFKQALSAQSALTIEAFYKERKDMIAIRPYLEAYPTTYYTFGNRDFSSTKGMSLKYDLRRLSHLRMNIAYTLQFAEGTGSSTTSGNAGQATQISPNGLLQNFITAGLPNLRYINALDIDSRHSLVASLDYRYDEGEGPIAGGVHFLQNAGLNLIFKARSGEPYTRYQDPVEIDRTIIGGVGGSRLPWHYDVDLRIDKDFRLTAGKKHSQAEASIKPKKPLIVNVFIYTQNLLNTRDILAVYGYSNRANDDGYLTSSYGIQHAAAQTSPQSYIDLTSYQQNLQSHYNYPRTISLGFQFNF